VHAGVIYVSRRCEIDSGLMPRRVESRHLARAAEKKCSLTLWRLERSPNYGDVAVTGQRSPKISRTWKLVEILV